MSEPSGQISGYLLDLNTLRAWKNEKSDDHKHVLAHIAALPPASPLLVSVITIAEIQYGHELTDPTGVQNVEFNEFMRDQFPDPPLEVKRSTGECWGFLRARLFENYTPEHGRRGLRAAQLVDPVTDHELGIDENDLWLAAQAMEYDLTLVTHDKMNRIREVAADTVRFEDWRKP